MNVLQSADRGWVKLALASCVFWNAALQIGRAESRMATSEEKIPILTEISAASRRNYEALQTWSGGYSYHVSDKIAAQAFGNFAKFVGIKVPQGDAVSEPVWQIRSGKIDFQRTMADNRLFLEILDDGPLKFVGEVTSASYDPVGGSVPAIRNERALVSDEGIVGYMPKLLYRVKSGPGVPGGYTTAASTMPRRKLKGPIWAHDTNPWTGQYFDPANLYGDDRFVWELLDGYVSNLRGKFGADHASAIDAAIRLEVQDTPEGGTQYVLTTVPPMMHKRRVFASRAAGNLLEVIEYSRDPDAAGNAPIGKQMEFEYWRVNDVVVPERVRCRSYTGDQQELVKDAEYRLKSVEVNGQKVSSTWTDDVLDIPSDAWQLVRRGKRQELVPPESAEKTDGKFAWLVALNISFGMILYGSLRRRERMKSMTQAG
ncbi:MAG: hypothetical protein SH850_16675 [Planctomycetaceae bacterium]|nr:hypothetical protein [Planctomycetaceae bacterium]